tara:strand:+ start:69 stop:542 length:474 start_codon:yes stop_codon:yes gene_type:complete
MTPISVAIRSSLALSLVLPIKQAWAFPANLRPIAFALEQRGWTVLLKAPPRKGIYGMANSTKKTIWVHPITEAMGIMPQTLVHEAVHAVQACKTGKMTPLGYKPAVDYVVDRAVFNNLYRNYSSRKWDIEKEAFAIQAQPNRIALIMNLIEKYCPLR